MKTIKTLLAICTALFLMTSCFDDLDDNLSSATPLEIKDFVWKGMNTVYLYKPESTDLDNENNDYNKFPDANLYTSYLNSFESPEALFESLKYSPETVDRFSRITNNYFDLQNQLQGISESKGIEFNLYTIPGSETEVFGVITLVLNNSVASNLGLQRGQFFRAVNGINLNTNNLEALLLQTTYTLNFADYNTNETTETDDDEITLNGQSTELTAANYTENPVHIAEVLTVNGTDIGYLMYNAFNDSFNGALNDAFGTFQSSGITELVIDLRYNGGGSVQTAAYLGSMVTGQFTGDVYSKLLFNENLESRNKNYLFTNTIEGVGTINSLNLSKVYVLTTNKRTASASELVINSLSAYIDVVVIGENTVGKTQASVTVYDSPTYSSQNINPSHTYAMQPLVANSINVNDALVPSNGLIPTIELSERAFALGELGNVNEPLLAAAIADITGADRAFNIENTTPLKHITFNGFISSLEQDMYIDTSNL
ncbi:MAG: S41 family peptidase [Winogradskyella sp.]